jgi:hypothetical protein
VSPFVDERHALYVGWIVGLGMRNGVDVRPIVDGEGNYTDRVWVGGLAAGIRVELVVPYPPDNWEFG